MEEQLRTHMDNLFEVVPNTEENLELKEEILQNLIDKYHDLLNEGKSEEVAFSIAISSVGDIRELLGDMSYNGSSSNGRNPWQFTGSNGYSGNAANQANFSNGSGNPNTGEGGFSDGNFEQAPETNGYTENDWQNDDYSSEYYSTNSGFDMNNDYYSSYETEYAAWKKRSALFVSGAVMLYILSIIPPIILSTFNLDDIGAVFMFILIAIATGLLIFNKRMQPTPPRPSGNMVQDFKTWQKENNENHKLYKSLNDMLWCIIVALYFIISFTTGAWHISWVIFLIGSALSSALKAVIDLVNPQNNN